VADLYSDPDAGDTLTFVRASGTSHGGVKVSNNGVLRYTPGPTAQALRAGEELTDSFRYSVEDQAGAQSAEKAITITVASVNDAPVATDDGLTVNEDAETGNLWGTLLANDTDPELAIAARSPVSTRPGQRVPWS
jgi:VCBS repeat-containing protein